METIGIHEPDNLNGGIKFPEMRDTRTIPAGVAIKPGDILGIDFRPITESGTVDSVARSPVSADAAVRICVVAETGTFNSNELFTGDSTTPMSWKEQLRKLSIFVRSPAP